MSEKSCQKLSKVDFGGVRPDLDLDLSFRPLQHPREGLPCPKKCSGGFVLMKNNLCVLRTNKFGGMWTVELEICPRNHLRSRLSK